jgi:hypothetical protein
LYYEEIARVWILCNDAANANRYGTEEPIIEEKALAEQRVVLV